MLETLRTMYEKMSGTFGRHIAFGHIEHYDDRRLRRMAQEAGVFEGVCVASEVDCRCPDVMQALRLRRADETSSTNMRTPPIEFLEHPIPEACQLRKESALMAEVFTP